MFSARVSADAGTLPTRRRRFRPLSRQRVRNQPEEYRVNRSMLALLLFVFLSAGNTSGFVLRQTNHPHSKTATIEERRINYKRHRHGWNVQRPRRISVSNPLDMVASTKASMADGLVNEEFESSGSNNNHHKAKDATTTSTTSELSALGWKPHFEEQLAGFDDLGLQKTADGLLPVRITEVRSKRIHVVGAGGIDKLIPISKGQKIVNDNEEKVVVAGDWILVEPSESNVQSESEPMESNSINGEKDGTCQQQSSTAAAQAISTATLKIRKILNRRSAIQRKAPGRKTRKKQVIAANLDTVFVVSSCNQDFNVARLERYIAMVLETQTIQPVIVLTKKDLLELDDMDMDDLELDEDDEEYELDDDDEEDLDEDFDESDASSWLLDYYMEQATSIAGGTIPVVCLDARNGSSASELLQPWLGEGQTVAFVGSSGVGKSTLVNSLCGCEVAATGDIHTDSGQGRHTTTRRQLHFLNRHDENDNVAVGKDNCCAILDTPGLRELQLVDVSQGLDAVFRDLVELSWECKFNDCTHSGEPGCAIASALENGDIDDDRLARWAKLKEEDALNTREVSEGRAERERKRNKRRLSGQSKPKPK